MNWLLEHRQDARPLVSAAGGDWSCGEAENSVEALEAAMAHEADLVALDVRRCRDGSWIVFRDATLARMTGVAGRVADLSGAMVTRLPLRVADGGRGARASRCWVPYLSEALAAARDGVPLLLRPGHPNEAAPLAAVVAEAGLAEQVLLRLPMRQSSDLARAQAVREEFGVQCCAVADLPAGEDWSRLALAMSAPAPVIELRSEAVFRASDGVDRLREAGRLCLVSTHHVVHSGGGSDAEALADPDRIWGALADRGVSIIETARPRELARWARGRVAA